MIIKSRYREVVPYKTRDGSEIRELLHPEAHGNRNQSLAEATIETGEQTLLHLHHHTEELYHILSGTGLMMLGEQQFEVVKGDTVCIPPGASHCIKNTGLESLRFLCCCSPAYSHDDTELLARISHQADPDTDRG